jgi:hypothetical protein
MTPNECPEGGTRHSFKNTLVLRAGRIAVLAIAGVVSILSEPSLVTRFFGGY